MLIHTIGVLQDISSLVGSEQRIILDKPPVYGPKKHYSSSFSSTGTDSSEYLVSEDAFDTFDVLELSLDCLSSFLPFFFLGGFDFSSLDTKDGNGSSRHLSLSPFRAFSEHKNCFRGTSPW